MTLRDLDNKMEFKCPICQKAVPPQSNQAADKDHGLKSTFPFCSKRCKLIDIGAWLDARYGIPDDSQADNTENGEAIDNGNDPGH